MTAFYKNLLHNTLLAGFVIIGSSAVFAGPYPPAAGQPGSTAIYKDDPNIINWAADIVVQRGYVDITNPALGLASYGSLANALGKAQGDLYNVASLGDGGSVTLSFEYPIRNAPGYDFAVFENSFNGTFLELAFVEVSSNGIDFFRFSPVSLTQTESQIHNDGSLEATDLHNLAGKYIAGYGTPFDLDELKDVNSLLDVNYITHVRIIDVVGSIDRRYARYDSLGNIINDPWPTPFETGGFDLDAVGVINEKMLLTDFDNDGTVNFSDYCVLAAAYLSEPNNTNWNYRCDISSPTDNIIDMLDVEQFSYEWLTVEQ